MADDDHDVIMIMSEEKGAMVGEVELKSKCRKPLLRAWGRRRALLTELARTRCTLNVVEENSPTCNP